MRLRPGRFELCQADGLRSIRRTGRGPSDRLIEEVGRRHAREAEALRTALPYGPARQPTSRQVTTDHLTRLHLPP